MKEYRVMITESVVMIGKVKANSREEAEKMAKEYKIKNDNIELIATNHRDFRAWEEETWNEYELRKGIL